MVVFDSFWSEKKQLFKTIFASCCPYGFQRILWLSIQLNSNESVKIWEYFVFFCNFLVMGNFGVPVSVKSQQFETFVTKHFLLLPKPAFWLQAPSMRLKHKCSCNNLKPEYCKLYSLLCNERATFRPTALLIGVILEQISYV